METRTKVADLCTGSRVVDAPDTPRLDWLTSTDRSTLTNLVHARMDRLAAEGRRIVDWGIMDVPPLVVGYVCSRTTT